MTLGGNVDGLSASETKQFDVGLENHQPNLQALRYDNTLRLSSLPWRHGEEFNPRARDRFVTAFLAMTLRENVSWVERQLNPTGNARSSFDKLRTRAKYCHGEPRQSENHFPLLRWRSVWEESRCFNSQSKIILKTLVFTR
jgi:hypothetical protein